MLLRPLVASVLLTACSSYPSLNGDELASVFRPAGGGEEVEVRCADASGTISTESSAAETGSTSAPSA